MASISEIIESYRLRKIAEAEAAAKRPGPPKVPHPKTISAANTHEVVREQVEYLIEHAEATKWICCCSECKRYERIREVAMEPFAEAAVLARGASA